jgi:cyanophycinase-like exopeptidase
MKHLLLLIFTCFTATGFGQSITSYFTGNATDLVTVPDGGICMMGGASEHDEAMKWFLERANGGDILVLRASGSDGYNNYMYSQLGVNVNSVETIVFNASSGALDPYVHQRISEAEAIWFAGGDQWDYVSYWRNTPVDSLINAGLTDRNIVIGGTSAGMAIMGRYYFSAQNGTVTSSAALANPYSSLVQVDSTCFLKNEYLEDVVTDSHYDDPDRRGRHTAFLARIYTDYGVVGKGIACNEYTAVCVDENGLARVFGDWPNYDEDAYFVQPNCELADFSPELCSPGQDLDWNLGQSAVKVYKVHGTNNGANTFDLSDWETGSGGEWLNWYVANGVFHELQGPALDCSGNSIDELQTDVHVAVYPNPATDQVTMQSEHIIHSYTVVDLLGKECASVTNLAQYSAVLNVSQLSAAVYLLHVQTEVGGKQVKLIIR